MRTPTLLDAALWYASKGYPVLPVHYPKDGFCSCGGEVNCAPCKHPMNAGGLLNATTDVDQIRKWWSRWPEANVAIRPPEGVAVCDVDDGGEETLAAHEPINGTPEVRTPRGGSHLWLGNLPYPLANGVKKLPGIDLRTHDGYVLAPPSRTFDGEYAWKTKLNGHFADCPAWLAEAFKKGGRGDAGPAGPAVAPAVIQEGERDRTLFAVGCRMRYAGADEGEILGALLIFNKNRCRPPLDPAMLNAKAKWICEHYAAGELIRVDSETLNGRVPEGVRMGSIAELAGEYSVTGLPTGFRFIDGNTTTGGLPDKQVSVFSAYTGTGKTGAMLQVADYVIEQGIRVVYATFADGDATDIRDRLLIMRTGWKGQSAPDLSESLRDHWLEQKAILSDSDRYPLYVYDATKGKGRRQLAPCLDYAREVSPGLLIVDYAQKVRSEKGRSPMEHAEDCCDALAEFAGELGIPVLLGSQLTLGNAKAGTLDITKGSREWEEAAAIHMRIRVFEEKDLEKVDYAFRDISGISEWALVKNRRTATHPAKRVCYARWNAQRIRFEELI